MSDPLKIEVTADVSSLDKGLDDVKNKAVETGKVASVNLSKIEDLLEQINAAAGKCANTLEKGFAKANPEVAKYEASIKKLEGQVSKLQAQLDKLSKMPSAPAPKGPEEYGKSLDQLRAKFNPLFAVGLKYRESLEEIANAEKAGALSSFEAAQARQDAANAANTQMLANSRLQAGMGALNATTKLTANQALNLSRQLNDVATMAALGAPPMQIFASQAGQIWGALEEGPQGVRGSLQALKSMFLDAVNWVGPLRIGLFGVTAAVGAFALLIRKDVVPIDEIIKRQTDNVRKLRDAYGLAGDSAVDYAQRSRRALEFTTNKDAQKDLEQLRERAEGIQNLFRDRSRGDVFANDAGFGQLRTMVDDLALSAKNGVPDVNALREGLVGIIESQQGQGWFGSDSTPLAILAEQIFDMTENLPDAQAALEEFFRTGENSGRALVERINEISRSVQGVYRQETEAQQLRNQLGQQLLLLDIAPGTAQDRDRQRMAAYEEYTLALGKISSDAIRTQQRTANALINAGLSDLDRELAEINQRYNDLIADRKSSQGDAAGIAALESSRLNELALARANAGRAADEEAQKTREATASRLASINSTVDGLRAQVATIGMSAGAAAEYQFRIDKLNDAQRALGENQVVSTAEITAINSAATQVGILTEQLAEYNRQKQQTDKLNEFQNDLFFRSQQLGRTPIEQSVAQSLRSLGLEYGNAANAGIEAQVRYIETMEAVKTETMDIGKITTDAFQEIVEAIGKGENALDGLIGGLARLGEEFARQGLQKAFGNLFPQTGTSNLPVNPNIQPGSGASPFFANNGPSSTQPLRALNDNLQSSANSALAVAKQFDGLNERADSKVLDSFLRASGNWNNLSAKDTAWCAAFANAAIIEAGGKGTGSNLASSFMNWGTSTNAPKAGDIVVLKPQSAGASGHVGFVAGFENGKVQIFGGNQSNAANTKSFGLDQVRDYRTGVGTGGIQSAISDGFVDAQKRLQSGSVPGVDRWAGMREVTPGAAGLNQAGGAANALSGVRNFLQSPTGQTAMVGVSAFAGGVQSGSPIGGALNGGLAAFGAMGFNPIGIGIGLVGGLLGGLFGRSKRKREERRQRQEQERQQQLQAQQQLAQQLPAILELQDTLLDRASGTLQRERTRIESQLKQYQELAKTAKNQAEIKRLQEMTEALNDYMERLFDQVRLTADSIILSMNQGRGLEPEFAKAASEVREMSLAIRNYITDLVAAVGETGEQVARARAAGQQQLLRQLSGPEQVSEIYTRLDTLYGTAAALGNELQKLGMSADQAAAAIRDNLNIGIQNIRNEFVRGIADETADAQGFGYFGQIRQLIERTNNMRADATSLGADTGLVDRLFAVQAQNIVNQLGLVDDALKPLLEAFPELTGVVTANKRSLDDVLLESQESLRTAYSHVKSFAESLRTYRNNIRLDASRTILSPLDRLTEAQNQFRAVSERAAAGDAQAQNELIGVSQAYLDEAKSYYASSEGYFNAFNEVDSVLKSSEATARSELAMAEAQYNALLTVNNSILTIPQAIAQLNEAQAARDLAQGQALQAYITAINPQAAVPTYTQPSIGVTPIATAPLAPPPVVAAQAPINRSLWNGSSFSNYVGNYQDYNGRRIFVPSGWTADRAWGLHVQQQRAPLGGANGPTYNSGMRLGGIVGAYQMGGMVGNGIWDQDSVIAKYAGGGNIALAGGEHITRAPSVTTETRGMLEHINKTGSLPRMSTNDNRMEGIERRLDRLTQTVALGLQTNVNAVEKGNGIASSQSDQMKLAASR